MSSTAEIYRNRRDECATALAALTRRSSLLSWIRLASGLPAVVLVGFALYEKLSGWWILPFVVAFLIAAVIHERVLRGRDRAARAVAYYDRGLARLAFEAVEDEVDRRDFVPPDHPYAFDLDVFGPRSLYARACVARTAAGRQRLADWLAAPAEIETIRTRQGAVAELVEHVELREALAAAGEPAVGDVDARALESWVAEAPCRLPGWLPIVAVAMTAANVAALLAWATEQASSLIPLASLALSGALASIVAKRVNAILGALEGPDRELELLRDLLVVVEAAEVASTELRAALAAVAETGHPSATIGRLLRLAQLVDSRRNLIFLPFALIGFVGTHVAYALERWKRRHRDQVAAWIEAVADVEALASLAAFAAEHPNAVSPRIEAEPIGIEARELGHPLIPPASCVTNPIELNADHQLLLVSGSNMSGKSTYLRAIGLNVVLALAGAPVVAERMRLSVLQVGACMRVQDSLQDGISHFYAELTRLRQITDLARAERPLLFLFDEIMHGTNSHDRRVGSEGLLRHLVDDGAIGLVTTHDLTLAAIVDRLGSVAAHVHFSDDVRDGKLHFDYRRRDGVVEHSNAIELMRQVGLEI